MPDIIFVQTRHDYQSYRDYWKLVQLSGFPVVYEDEMELDNPTHCYIITWFVAQADRFKEAKARVICWNLEWANNPILPGVEYWSPDAWYAKQNNWRYVPVGSHPKLQAEYGTYQSGEMFDIALMMYRDVQRRRMAIQALHLSRLTIAPNAWNVERHHYLTQSRCMVHIHQLDNVPAVSSLRFALAAYYSMPVITEQLGYSGIFSGHVIESHFDALSDCVRKWLDPVRRVALADYGRKLYQLLCVDYLFADAVNRNV